MNSYDKRRVLNVIRQSYVCISDFDEVLGNVGLDIDEIKEIFDKEPWK